ncbi:hypothetical protein Zmor_004143 [Zophobas morio]|uniref:Uncharacterized protein n=1 Tax=Zophobas morio TaxID=2755281 RepID=A0AA38HIP0_9CUCU|nr:hypothetical protein Zmor_004143 [Zophobas morio]
MVDNNDLDKQEFLSEVRNNSRETFGEIPNQSFIRRLKNNEDSNNTTNTKTNLSEKDNVASNPQPEEGSCSEITEEDLKEWEVKLENIFLLAKKRFLATKWLKYNNKELLKEINFIKNEQQKLQKAYCKNTLRIKVFNSVYKNFSAKAKKELNQRLLLIEEEEEEGEARKLAASKGYKFAAEDSVTLSTI